MTTSDREAIGTPLMLAYNDVGRQHMMFGTDYPFTSHGPERVEELPISAEDKGADARRECGSGVWAG
jgi:predicted TIM-barrel fold metal-dependent hydrolase